MTGARYPPFIPVLCLRLGTKSTSRAVKIGVSVIGGVVNTSANPISGAIRLGIILIGRVVMLGASQHQMIQGLPRLAKHGAIVTYMPIDLRQVQYMLPLIIDVAKCSTI